MKAFLLKRNYSFLPGDSPQLHRVVSIHVAPCPVHNSFHTMSCFNCIDQYNEAYFLHFDDEVTVIDELSYLADDQ